MIINQAIIVLVDLSLLMITISWIIILFRRKPLFINSWVLLLICSVPFLWLFLRDFVSMGIPIDNMVNPFQWIKGLAILPYIIFLLYNYKKLKRERILFGIDIDTLPGILKNKSLQNDMEYNEETKEITLFINQKEIYFIKPFAENAGTIFAKRKEDKKTKDQFNIIRQLKNPIEETTMNNEARILLILAILYFAAALYFEYRFARG